MKINSPLDLKVNIRPIIFTMNHTEAYQGPCRYGKGEELTYEYDVRAANAGFEEFKEKILPQINPAKANLVEPVLLTWTQDFILKEELFEEALKNDSETDLYFIYGLRLSQFFATELAKRTKKPLALMPNIHSFSLTEHVEMSAPLLAQGRKLVFPCADIVDVNETVDILHAKKVLSNTNCLYPLKDEALSVGCLSAFLSLEAISDRFGIKFTTPDFTETFKELDNLTKDDIAEAQAITDDLVKTANGVHMPPENILKDVEYYIAIKKMLKKKGCNAFTIKCFEICATKELNKRQLTFCLTHSLLKDEKISSACAGDACSVVTQNILMALTNKAPFMGNTMVIDRQTNQCKILHDVPSKKMKGYDAPEIPIDYVAFTMSNWGATMRVDFAKEAGNVITMINLSPDMSKLMVVKGTINGGKDFLTNECKLACLFKVEDVEKFISAQKYVGHHFAFIYGDYTKKIKKFADLYELELLEA